MNLLAAGLAQRLFHYPPEARGERSAARFIEVGGALLRSASLVKGGTSKKRLSPHLHKVPTWSNKVSPRTFQTTLYAHTKSLLPLPRNS
jgi:hypothetical protein